MNQQVLEKANEICMKSQGKILKVCDVGVKEVYVLLKSSCSDCVIEAFELIESLCPGVKPRELVFDYNNNFFDCRIMHQSIIRYRQREKDRNLIDQGIKNYHLADF